MYVKKKELTSKKELIKGTYKELREIWILLTCLDFKICNYTSVNSQRIPNTDREPIFV